MTTVFSLVFVVGVVGIALGLHAVQSRLERWTYDKHFDE